LFANFTKNDKCAIAVGVRYNSRERLVAFEHNEKVFCVHCDQIERFYNNLGYFSVSSVSHFATEICKITWKIGQILVDQILCPISADIHKINNLGESAGPTRLSVNISWPTKANVNIP